MLEKINLENINGAEKTTDHKKIYRESFIDVSEQLKPQPVAISIGETMYKGVNYPVPFGSYGDYSCIVGASKSRKTFLKSAIMAAYIGGQAQNYFPNMQGHDATGKVVIEIDTEQSKFHSQRVFKRTCEMVGANYDNYYPFSLREYSPKERYEFIDWLIMESEHRDNIGLISIDGYVDLVTDFNSLEQATDLQEKLLSWTTRAKCHITGVLHKNHGTNKPVGHVGSSVLKKAETIVFVEPDQDKKTTHVKCEYSRNIAFNDFKFTVNSDWLPELVDDGIF